MEISELKPLLEAISFAARKHKDQWRDDRETPYIAHPLRVAFIANLLFGIQDPSVLTALILHDTIEDTDTTHDEIFNLFGKLVADRVQSLSKDRSLKTAEREKQFLHSLAKADSAVQICKLADTLDNLWDSQGISQQKRNKCFAKAQQVIKTFQAKASESSLKTALSIVNQVLIDEKQAPEKDT